MGLSYIDITIRHILQQIIGPGKVDLSYPLYDVSKSDHKPIESLARVAATRRISAGNAWLNETICEIGQPAGGESQLFLC